MFLRKSVLRAKLSEALLLGITYPSEVHFR